MYLIKKIINWILNLLVDNKDKPKLKLINSKKEKLEKEIEEIENEKNTLEDNVNYLND